MFLCLEATSTDFDTATSRECCPLKVHENTVLAGRVVFGCTDSVGVPSRYLASSFT